jgi:hypothetical protein
MAGEKRHNMVFIMSYFSCIFLFVMLLTSGCIGGSNIQGETAPTTQIPTELSPTPIAHWSFDEEGGNIVKDSIDGLDGIVHGAKFVEGKKSNALYFDGVDDYVQLSQKSFDRVSSLNQGTIAFWFKFESILYKQNIMPIFYLGMDDERDEDNILIIEVGHFKQGELRSSDPENKRLYSTFIKDNSHPFLCLDSGRSLGEGEWTHYALVSGPNGTNVYINGEGIPANYNFGKLGDKYFLSDIPNTEVIMIGRGKSSSMTTPQFVHYKGYIDDLRIYAKPLTRDEIQKLL